MKKILCALLTLCISLSICIPVFAKTDMETVFDNTDELKQVEDKILDTTNMLLSADYNGSISSDDIDYSNCLRSYDGYTLFTDDSITEDNIIEALDNLYHDYDIFLKYNDVYPHLVFMQIRPMLEEVTDTYSEEEIKEHDSHIGELELSSITIRNDKAMFQYYKEDIEKFLIKSKETYSKVHVLYNLPGDLGAVAMLVSEDSEIRFKVLDGKIDNKQIDYKNTDDTLYTLAELKAVAKQYTPQDSEFIGGTEATAPQPSNNKTVIIAAVSAGAVIIAASAVIIVCIKKKKASAETDN